MKETDHDYQGCLCGNFYNLDASGSFNSWIDFAKIHCGFCQSGFDDTYNFVFRYDVHKNDDRYILELCMMLQRKGIYTHLWIYNITQDELDTVVYDWLLGRKQYIDSLWKIK